MAVYPRFPTTPKKGAVAGTTVPSLGPPQYTAAQTQALITALNPSWWYNYLLSPAGVVVPNGRFVPMFWDLAGNQYPGADPFNFTTIGTAVASAGPGGNVIICAEPDAGCPSSCRTTPADAIVAWNTFNADSRVIAAGITPVAPATQTLPLPGSWFDTFYTGATIKPTRIAIDSYGGNPADVPASVTAVYNRIQQWKLRYPTARLWINEYGLLPVVVGDCVPDAAQIAFDQQLTALYESDPAIERYGRWLLGPQHIPATASFPCSALADDTAVLRPTGAAYVLCGSVYQ